MLARLLPKSPGSLLPLAARAVAYGQARGVAGAAASATDKEDKAEAEQDALKKWGMPVAPHQGMKRAKAGDDYMMFHPVYTPKELNVSVTHRDATTLRQRIALALVTLMRSGFDYVSGYDAKKTMTESHWLNRMIFLETVAGVPGMVAGMLRHTASLRRMKRDGGWIHTLLEEAENERMHLLTFIQLKNPGWLFRGAVLATQGLVFNLYLAAYLLSPATCHSFVGYLEEEAVKTYTHALHDLDSGALPVWAATAAPPIAIEYWRLDKGATMRDLLAAVRADEACHRHVNHVLSDLGYDDPNPFGKGQHVQGAMDGTLPPAAAR